MLAPTTETTMAAPIYSQSHLDLIVAQSVQDERTRLADLLEDLAATHAAEHLAWIHEAYPRWRKGEGYEAFQLRYHSYREKDAAKEARTEALYDAALALRKENL